MSEYQWLLNNGLAVAVVVFIGFLLWRVLVGTKATGYQGMLIRWANALSQDIKKHSAEATSEFAKGRTERTTQIEALQLLVESQAPPIGAAFIAAKAVHETAANVEHLITGMKSAKAAMREVTLMCRLVAKQLPDLQADINKHCVEIERIIDEV
jgi:hypothetical protein